MRLELQVEMLRSHLTIKNIAEKTGISISALSRKLNGASEFNVKELRSIKDALNLSNERFMEIFFSQE